LEVCFYKSVTKLKQILKLLSGKFRHRLKLLKNASIFLIFPAFSGFGVFSFLQIGNKIKTAFEHAFQDFPGLAEKGGIFPNFPEFSRIFISCLALCL